MQPRTNPRFGSVDYENYFWAKYDCSRVWSRVCLNQKGILLGAVPESLVAVIPELLEQRPALQLRLEPMFARRLNSSECLTALWQTLEDSFSAVSKPIFCNNNKNSLESSWRDLSDLHSFAPLESHNKLWKTLRPQEFNKLSPQCFYCFLMFSVLRKKETKWVHHFQEKSLFSQNL